MGSEVNEFKSVNAIVICTKVNTAKATAPKKIDKKAPREVGTGQVRGRSRVINSLVHTTASLRSGRRGTSRGRSALSLSVITKSYNESKRFDIITYAEEEAGYAVKSGPIEADPRKTHGLCAAQLSRSS